MTPSYSVTGRRRHIFVPASAESLPPRPAQPQDPPIYRALMRTWADRGRTLPGRHDPEWVRLAAFPAGLGQFGPAMGPLATNITFGGSPGCSFSETRGPRGDER
ncbi:hypothetical protein GCM10017771_55000 [Streptomyces capitiformicae]|uniref:Uncharacterized protein n=1 Tax=Streptomyces capitiformicae TaxID=2014920 RepID=A0A919DDW7_9ACTN|nr:hypothetical protein GCM10017771_55000 [Streptomyces capitiformicae]